MILIIIPSSNLAIKYILYVSHTIKNEAMKHTQKTIFYNCYFVSSYTKR